MASNVAPHSAATSAVGYYYQALYALIVLLRDKSDHAAVYLETKDDVEKQNNDTTSLYQLKYSGSKSQITVADHGLWKTIGIWLGVLDEHVEATPSFFFVTTRPISPDSALACLKSPKDSREDLRLALDQEAKRYTSRPDADTTTAKFRACSSYLGKPKEQRIRLLSHITICPESFDPSDVDEAVAKELTLITAKHRLPVAQRLIEWWDTQAFRSLMSSSGPEALPKTHVQSKLSQLFQELADDALFDDFSTAQPPDTWAEAHGMMERQIRLVGGTDPYVFRAARDKWRAREQRGRWLNDDIGIAEELESYDHRLIEEWSDQHEVIRDEAQQQPAEVQASKGLRLLQWTHTDAPSKLPPLRPAWTQPFLTRGTYQMLSEDMVVGWHPYFRELLAEEDGTEDSNGTGEY